jgi:hypothetical protein
MKIDEALKPGIAFEFLNSRIMAGEWLIIAENCTKRASELIENYVEGHKGIAIYHAQTTGNGYTVYLQHLPNRKDLLLLNEAVKAILVTYWVLTNPS